MPKCKWLRFRVAVIDVDIADHHTSLPGRALDVRAAVQAWLLQETYRSEHVITAFLEDATVDLVACSISVPAAGQKQLSISNTADFSQTCDFQVCLQADYLERADSLEHQSACNPFLIVHCCA